jgi:hypothetical protein
VNILPNTEDWADNTTALSGMSGEELQAAVTNRNIAHILIANRRKALMRGLNIEAPLAIYLQGYSRAFNCNKPVSAFRAQIRRASVLRGFKLPKN